MNLTRKQRIILSAYFRRRRQRIANFIVQLSAISYNHLRKQRITWVKKRAQNFWFEVISMHWNEEDWLSNLRMDSESFKTLLNQLAPYISKQDTNFRKAIPADVRLAICLYFLSHSSDYATISNLFGIGRATAYQVIMQVCRVIVDKLLHKYIKLPNTDELRKIIDGFEELSGFPQIAGAIDCCHIGFKAPHKHAEDYVNRKDYHSIILQGLVDNNYLFTDICIGWPGKCHDARVFRNSTLFENCQSPTTFLSAELSKNIGGKNINPLIIGDAAFGSLNLTKRTGIYLMKRFTSIIVCADAVLLLKMCLVG